jgi:hypothetical protein
MPTVSQMLSQLVVVLKVHLGVYIWVNDLEQDKLFVLLSRRDLCGVSVLQ